jgi:hypothetical protein
MAPSNYQIGLKRRYARWLGERAELQKEIKKIEDATASLDEKKQRLATLDELTSATEILMKELDPDWNPDTVEPQKTQKQVLPWEHGLTTATAFDIIRELNEPISTLELSKLTIARLGSDPNDPDLLDRVRSNLDQSLRKASDHIQNVGGRPSRWKVRSIDEMVIPKPPS